MPEAEAALKQLKEAVAQVVVGQHDLVDGLLTGLLCGGHILVEGVPGLAKTTAVRSFAAVLGLPFGRVQFTPDLLPGDLTGNPLFHPEGGEQGVRRGPIFVSVLLADEINRAPAKVQSALLEAMEEGQVTIGEQSLALPDPFLVMATQNPVELEGTYPLPEAQVDRFLLKLLVPYPSEDEELEIVARDARPPVRLEPVLDHAGVCALRAAAGEVHVSPEVAKYAVRIARATREPTALAESVGSSDAARKLLSDNAQKRRLLRTNPVQLGASPRASIFLVRAARARALLDSRRFVTPDDVKRVARDVLRHRVVVSYEAEADGITPEDVIEAVLATVESP